MELSAFASLPNEKIVEICELLDDKSLWQLTQSHGKFYQLCRDELTKRRDRNIYLTPSFMNILMENLRTNPKGSGLLFIFKQDGNLRTILIQKEKQDKFIIGSFSLDLNQAKSNLEIEFQKLNLQGYKLLGVHYNEPLKRRMMEEEFSSD